MVFVKVVFAETDAAKGGTLPEKEKGCAFAPATTASHTVVAALAVAESSRRWPSVLPLSLHRIPIEPKPLRRLGPLTPLLFCRRCRMRLDENAPVAELYSHCAEKFNMLVVSPSALPAPCSAIGPLVAAECVYFFSRRCLSEGVSFTLPVRGPLWTVLVVVAVLTLSCSQDYDKYRLFPLGAPGTDARNKIVRELEDNEMLQDVAEVPSTTVCALPQETTTAHPSSATDVVPLTW